MRRIFLGSTALVAAGLLTWPAVAQLQLSIDGSVDMHAGFASEQRDQDRRATGITTDTTLNFDTDGVADNGLEYGSRINFDDNGDEFRIDEVYAFVSGRFGEIRFGSTDPGASELRLTVPAVGNGQADGDFRRYIQQDFAAGTNFESSGDHNKIVYFRGFDIADTISFNLGASYAPDDDAFGDDPAQNQITNIDDTSVTSRSDVKFGDFDYENIISIGGNFRGDLRDTRVIVSMGANFADAQSITLENAAPEDSGPFDSSLTEYGIGAELDFGAIEVGGFYITSELDQDFDFEFTRSGLGTRYSTGPWSFAANALFANVEGASGTIVEDTIYGVGVEYEWLDGLTPYADLVFFDNDQDGTEFDNDGSVLLTGITARF